MERTVSIHAAIQDYIEDAGLEGNIDESVLIRWIHDYDNMSSVAETFQPYIVLVYLENYKVTLPDNFKIMHQVVFSQSEPQDDCTTDISDVGFDECNLRPIPRRDRLWEITNPEVYKSGWFRKDTIGNGPTTRKRSQNWVLLRPAMDNFHMNRFFLNDCVNLNVDRHYPAFNIDGNVMSIDRPEGAVIISYLGTKLDENGDILLIDDAYYLEGLINHLDYKWWARESKAHAYSEKKNMQLFKQYSREAKRDRDISIRMFKARATAPDYADWNQFVQKVWNQRIPGRNFHENGGRGTNMGIFERYSNLIDGNRTKPYV